MLSPIRFSCCSAEVSPSSSSTISSFTFLLVLHRVSIFLTDHHPLRGSVTTLRFHLGRVSLWVRPDNSEKFHP